MNLEILQEKLGYKFKDTKLLKAALTHKSANSGYNNERLEFLGDAVMDLVVAEYLFKKLNTSEGDLSKLRAALVNEKSFSKFANLLNLGENLILSQAEEKNGGRSKDSLLSDAFEAIFGAIYLESGIEPCKEIAVRILEEIYPKIDPKTLLKDHKTALQELTQGEFGVTPEYRLIGSKGPDHMKEFEMAVILGDKELSRAVGKSKKEAEQKAAKIAIEILEKN